MTAFLFITDLDNTLVGDDDALKELNQQLEQHRQDYGTKIVYATGRSPALYRKLTSEKSLLSPDALITSVGTEICFNPQEKIFDPEWADMLAQGWNRDAVVAIAAHYSDLLLQPETEQRPFKVSYVLSEEISSEVLPRLESSLKEKGLDVKLIYSGGQDLDILPCQGDKGLAVQFLRQKWDMDATKTVVCGDSGNDIALFSAGEERGILVGNAKPELRQWYEANKKDYHYFAQADYADGILEGLHHLGFLV
ncbi:MAG: sucrose-phosphate phosphatase [Coleofasciculus sp. A1-SPW-01]|uniref:sucrose-phosphate phosphatase n=1 Tax=Coleofasciculus sp. A1-SPW-01 TaxID=3070819 RepID=UPI0033041232